MLQLFVVNVAWAAFIYLISSPAETLSMKSRKGSKKKLFPKAPASWTFATLAACGEPGPPATTACAAAGLCAELSAGGAGGGGGADAGSCFAA